MDLPPLVQKIIGDASQYKSAMQMARTELGATQRAMEKFTTGPTFQVKGIQAMQRDLTDLSNKFAKLAMSGMNVSKQTTDNFKGLERQLRALSVIASDPKLTSTFASFLASKSQNKVVDVGTVGDLARKFVGDTTIQRTGGFLSNILGVEKAKADLKAIGERIKSFFSGGAYGIAKNIGGGILGAGGSIFGKMFNTGSIIGLATTLLGVNAVLTMMEKAWNAVTNAIHKAISTGMEMDRMRVVFSVLLGDVQEGAKAFSDIQSMSLVTPYSVQALTEVAEQLLSMGVAGKDLNDTMAALGNIALGDEGKLRKLAAVFGEIEQGGRLTQFRFREFAKMGITTSDFAKAMGISVQDVQHLLAGGGIGRGDLAKTINMLNAPGGRFAEANQKQMETTVGQWERLRNVIDITLGKMGEAFLKSMGAAKGLQTVGDWIDSMQPKLITFSENVGKIFGEITKYTGPMLESAGIAGTKAVSGIGERTLPEAMKPDFSGSIVDGFIKAVELVSKALAALTVAITEIVDGIRKGVAAFLSVIAGLAETLGYGTVGKKGGTIDKSNFGFFEGGGLYGLPAGYEDLFGNDEELKKRYREGKPVTLPDIKGTGAAGELQKLSESLGSPGTTYQTILGEGKRAYQTTSEFWDEFHKDFNKRVQNVQQAVDIAKKAAPLLNEHLDDLSATAQDMVNKIRDEFGLGGKAPKTGRTGEDALSQFRSNMEVLNEISGKGALPQDVLRSKAFGLFQNLQKNVGATGEYNLPGVAARGSSEAAETIQRSMSIQTDATEQIVTTLAQALALQRQSVRVEEESLEVLKQLKQDFPEFEFLGRK